MKRIISVVCVCVLALTLASCGKKPVQSITAITACESSVSYREALFSKTGSNTLSEDEQRARFENEYLPYLNARTMQAFPEVETKNTLEKQSEEYGDVYTLTGETQDVLVLYIHGGAWVWEIDKHHIDFCDKLVDTLNAKVYIPIYPLAPQSDYKDGYSMIESVYNELLKQNKPIIIMGDSAGATITLGFVLHLKDDGKQLPEKVVVLSPCADATFSDSEILEYQKKDGYLAVVECIESVKLWANGADLSIPSLSPINGDYEGFPDTLMFVADYDILYPDAMKLHEKMCEANINISLVKGEGFWHVFPIFSIEEQQSCLDLIRDFCK